MDKKIKEQQVPWYESNLLWGPVSLGAGILLAVVAAMKHDLRWLLYFAAPCFVFATWSLFKRWLRTWWLVAVLVVCTLLICGSLYGLGTWLGKPDQVESGGKAAKPGKAAIYFGEGPGTGSALPMNIFESGVALDGYAGENKIATLKMKPNGQVQLDVAVNDDTGHPMIEIHGDEFSVSRTDLDRNSSKNEFEVINTDGLVIFQLIRRSPSEIVINGVFTIAGGKSYLLAGPKGALETNVIRYDYVPKPLFKYPSWRFPGQYVTQSE